MKSKSKHEPDANLKNIQKLKPEPDLIDFGSDSGLLEIRRLGGNPKFDPETRTRKLKLKNIYI